MHREHTSVQLLKLLGLGLGDAVVIRGDVQILFGVVYPLALGSDASKCVHTGLFADDLSVNMRAWGIKKLTLVRPYGGHCGSTRHPLV